MSRLLLASGKYLLLHHTPGSEIRIQQHERTGTPNLSTTALCLQERCTCCRSWCASSPAGPPGAAWPATPCPERCGGCTPAPWHRSWLLLSSLTGVHPFCTSRDEAAARWQSVVSPGLVDRGMCSQTLQAPDVVQIDSCGDLLQLPGNLMQCWSIWHRRSTPCPPCQPCGMITSSNCLCWTSA